MLSPVHRVEGRTFKVCICGQQSVGKTAILHRRLSGSFSQDYLPTIASGFGTVVETVGDQPVTLNIWDTAGQEKYQSMMPLYLRNCECVILVLDFTAPASWDFVKTWLDADLLSIQPRPLVFICVNKADLDPAIDLDDLTDWASDLDYRIYQTSAFSGAGITQLFGDVATGLMNKKSERPVGKTEAIDDEAGARGCC
jgi:small GTP-binding protein